MPLNVGIAELCSALDCLFKQDQQQQQQPKDDKQQPSKAQANQWLEKFQHTPEAWEICQSALQNATMPDQVKVFAAQTIKAKSISDFRQLDVAARLSVRDSILALLQKNQELPKIVTTQLCLALVAVAMQLREWTDVVKQMVHNFGEQQHTIGCLVQFLSVLPVEVDILGSKLPISGKHVLLSENLTANFQRFFGTEKKNTRSRYHAIFDRAQDEDYKYQANALLTSNSVEVLQLITRYMEQSGGNAALQKEIFTCLSAWCKEFPVTMLANNPLLSFSFDALASDELFDEAVEVLCEIIRGTNDIAESMAVINVIYPRLVSLLEPLKNAAEEEDEDKLTGFLRIFTAAGEAYIPLILEHFDAFSSIIDGIMICTAFHDLDLVPKTFQFWYLLGLSVGCDKEAMTNPKIAGTYRKLFEIMLGHIRYPNDESWTAAARDEFRNFRHDMGDVLKDCVTVLGQHETLDRAYVILNSFLTGGDAASQRWQDVEAPLFAIRAMGSNVAPEENIVMPKLMALLDKLPPHPKIRYCATLVISRYAAWTAVHPDFIPYQLHIITSGFNNDEVVTASAHALKYLCQECKGLMVKYLQELHPFYIGATSSTILTLREVLEVTEAFAHVIGAVQPPSEMLSILQQFCLPIAQKLHVIATKETTLDKDDTKTVLDLLDQLSVFFEFVKPTTPIPADTVHPVIAVYDAVWPILDTIITSFGDRHSVAESVTHCLKHVVIVSDKERFMPTIPRLMSRTIAAFETTGLGCYLWLAGKAAREYAGASEATAAAMLESSQRLSNVVFGMFGSDKSFQDVPDVVEDYFTMMTNFLHAAPRMLICSSLLQSVFQCALAAIELEQRSSVFAVLIFFRDLFSEGSPRTDPRNAMEPTLEPLRQLIRDQGRTLINQFFKGLFYNFSKELVMDLGMVIKIMGDVVPAETEFWVKELIGGLPEDQLTKDEKSAFLNDFASSMKDDNIKRIRRVLTDLQILYRRKNVPMSQRGAAST